PVFSSWLSSLVVSTLLPIILSLVCVRSPSALGPANLGTKDYRATILKKGSNIGRSANGHSSVEGAKGNGRADYARVQASGAGNQPRQKGQEPETGNRDRAARGGRL